MATLQEQTDAGRRWWRRGDGRVFMIADPDHVKRVQGEGWQEVAGPSGDVLPAATETPVPAPEPTPVESPAEIQARNDAARAWINDAATAPQAQANAKPIRKARNPGEEA